jgi:hypothetical protein
MKAMTVMERIRSAGLRGKAYVPGRRAAATDPVRALRVD